MKAYFVCILVCALTACGTKQADRPKNIPAVISSTVDDKAIELSERMMQAMGGAKAWNEARFFRFDFVVESEGKEIVRHQHLWDKFTGRYRVQGKMRDGRSYCILYQDINKKTGVAFVDDKVIETREAEGRLQYGYNRFINDTYWIIMPWKLRDPGVSLVYEGLQDDSATGKNYEVVHVTFDQVGLTPKDQYWAFVNPETFLMEKWRFFLQDSEDGSYYWKNWQAYGVLKFSDEKADIGGKRKIKTENIRIFDQMNEDVFTNNFSPLP